MRLEAKKYLFDMRHAAALLAQFTAGKNFADYAADAMLSAAVEREFEIIGEALGQLAKLDAEDLHLPVTCWLSVRPPSDGGDGSRPRRPPFPPSSPRHGDDGPVRPGDPFPASAWPSTERLCHSSHDRSTTTIAAQRERAERASVNGKRASRHQAIGVRPLGVVGAQSGPWRGAGYEAIAPSSCPRPGGHTWRG